MQNPIQDLLNEHNGILQMLRILKKITIKLKLQEDVPHEDVEKVLEFLKEFADKCHHSKEEDILFPELERDDIDNDWEPLIVDLLEDHDIGREYTENMYKAFSLFNKEQNAYQEFIQNAEKYIALLTDHITKENLYLFPEADIKLDESTKASLDEQFETMEKEVIGLGKHELYHGWIDELSKRYL